MMKKISMSEMYIDDEIKKSVLKVLDSGRYVKGEELKRFEQEFANFCSAKRAVGVNSGTSAILLSLMAIGIVNGDQVIVPSHTFIATVSPIVFLGGKPVFVDIDSETYTIDPNDVENKISPKTKAIIPVHLYGHPCDMDPINELAKDNDLFVIEDACQAHGSCYKGEKIGSLKDNIACFSFYPSKNMTVCGDGGMIVTNNEEIAEKVAMLRDHGRREKYIHELLGLNLRLSEIHASIGREQIRHISEWTKKRHWVSRRYNQLLEDVDKIIVPIEKDWAKHVYHLYVIRTIKRDGLMRYLNENNIGTGIHYPIPVHKQPVMKSYSHVSLPVTEKIVKEVLSLPMHPQITENQIEYITERINEYIRGEV
jgi:perosamine synthetase